MRHATTYPLVEKSKQSTKDFDKTGGWELACIFWQQERENKKIQKTWKNYDENYVNFYINSKFLA